MQADDGQTPADRLAERATAWGISVERTSETATSILGFGWRGERPLVLKLIKRQGDEWRSGSILSAFAGRGVVHVWEHGDGAMLLDWLVPGRPLTALALHGSDDAATRILSDVIAKLPAIAASPEWPTIQDWAMAFSRYKAKCDDAIPAPLVAHAHRTFLRLADSQRNPRLLHGDLHHGNVLFDQKRGWLAIDPKGVVGELEYELGATLRNPGQRPDLFCDHATIEKRVSCFASTLNVDVERVLAWAYAQAVLSAIWSLEDGEAIGASDPVLTLAMILRGMLPDSDR